jgi:hypothetical protein
MVHINTGHGKFYFRVTTLFPLWNFRTDVMLSLPMGARSVHSIPCAQNVLCVFRSSTYHVLSSTAEHFQNSWGVPDGLTAISNKLSRWLKYKLQLLNASQITRLERCTLWSTVFVSLVKLRFKKIFTGWILRWQSRNCLENRIVVHLFVLIKPNTNKCTRTLFFETIR